MSGFGLNFFLRLPVLDGSCLVLVPLLSLHHRTDISDPENPEAPKTRPPALFRSRVPCVVDLARVIGDSRGSSPPQPHTSLPFSPSMVAGLPAIESLFCFNCGQATSTGLPLTFHGVSAFPPSFLPSADRSNRSPQTASS